MKSSLLCFAHRGASGYEPENTLRAVEKAIALGADWIEVDVQLAAGRLVVIHDETLERTTDGTGFVRERSFSYLRSLDAGKGEKIPTLEEVLAAVRGRAGLNIELKAPRTEDAVAELLEAEIKRGLDPGGIIVSSFARRRLERLRRLAPAIRTGALLSGIHPGHAAFAESSRCFSVHPALGLLERKFVRDAHARGLRVYAFTANTEQEIRRAADLGADGVFSDFPDRVLAFRDSIRGPI